MGRKVTNDMIYDLTPEQIRENFLESVSRVIPPERYEFAKKELEKISDEDLFGYFLHELIKHGGEIPTNKEALNDTLSFYKKTGLRVSETAFGKITAKYVGDPVSKAIIEKVRRSKPSDIIFIKSQEDDFIKDLWCHGDIGYIPSDLFFAKTIPLQDCEIVVDETDSGGGVCKYRVVIFDDYAENVDHAVQTESDDFVLVGVAFPEEYGGTRVAPIAFPIVVVRGVSALPNATYAKLDLNFGTKPDEGSMLDSLTVEKCVDGFAEFLSSWYGIQIALLHPAVKDVFKNPQRTPVEANGQPKGKTTKKRKVKYIRKHYLTLDQLETVSGCKEERKINRKCLAWYVIGHWRTYKSGKKVFIMPYWKGVLRNLKSNTVGDEREREIDIDWSVAEPQ